jgi:LmbE family N-acetylglucosaminyl deacetylase
MDAMTLLAIPSIAPDVAPILTQKNPPVLLYLFDRFTKPLKFEPDLIVDISGSYEDKISALERHESQVFEFVYGPCPHPASKPRERKEWLKTMAEGEIGAPGKKFRKEIEDAYGKELRYAEAFEVSEYGGRLTDEVKKRIFPFVPLAGKGKARM